MASWGGCSWPVSAGQRCQNQHDQKSGRSQENTLFILLTIPKRRQSKAHQDPDLLSCQDVQESTAIHPELRADRGFIQMSAKDHAAEDRDLVIRASEGDIGAFTKLVRDNSSLVYRVALRMLGNDDAQDASQEVWVKVWRNIKGFRGESAFTTWLYRITVNTCLSARRKEAHREEREYSGDEMPYLPEPSGGDADPEAVALNAERREEIQDALQHVRAEHRAALILRHMEGLSYAEIAEVLQVPDGTAKGWVSRGRAELLVALVQQRSQENTGEGEIS
jgi:RNA polymerase sigma-70 factor, ECF subfamily